MDIKRRAAAAMLAGCLRRQRDLVDHGSGMVGEHQLRPIDAVEAEQALDEIGLPPEQLVTTQRAIYRRHLDWRQLWDASGIAARLRTGRLETRDYRLFDIQHAISR